MKDFLRNNGLLILIIAALLAVLTGVGSVFLQGTANPLSNVLNVVATPVRDGLSWLAHQTEAIYNYAFEYDALKEENERLRKENADLAATAREGEAASRENERLRQLLGLREKRSDIELEAASVTARSTSNWTSTLTISKGSAEDVAVGDCVIDAASNLVGVVSEVGVNWSTLITVTDASLDMGGLVSRTECAAIVEGDFSLMSQGKLKLTYLPDNADVAAGDQILTSGRGGVYPSGLVVGSVESVLTDPSGMTRYAVLTPAADLDSLIEVFVIKSFNIVE